MSSEKVMYNAQLFGFTIQEFIASPCVLSFDDPRYVPPTPEQVVFLQHYLGLSLDALRAFVGVDFAYEKMDKNAWRHMLYAAGLADVHHDMAMAQKTARERMV